MKSAMPPLPFQQEANGCDETQHQIKQRSRLARCELCCYASTIYHFEGDISFSLVIPKNQFYLIAATNTSLQWNIEENLARISHNCCNPLREQIPSLKRFLLLVVVFCATQTVQWLMIIKSIHTIRKEMAVSRFCLNYYFISLFDF